MNFHADHKLFLEIGPNIQNTVQEEEERNWNFFFTLPPLKKKKNCSLSLFSGLTSLSCVLLLVLS